MKRIVSLCLLLSFFATAKTQEVVTLTQGKNIRTEKVTPTYRPTFPCLRLSLGVPRLLTLEYNYWIKPWLMVGAGTGYGMEHFSYHVYIPAFTTTSYQYRYTHYEIDKMQTRTGYGIPWFIEAELRTPKYKWSFFFNVKAGASIGVKMPYLEMPLGHEYYATDEYGNAVFSEVTATWHPFFMDATMGFGYKHFSMGIGMGLHGGNRSATLMLSYDIPLK